MCLNYIVIAVCLVLQLTFLAVIKYKLADLVVTVVYAHHYLPKN